MIDVPGEGEHKVMDMIRKEQKENEQFRLGKMRNCMYGLDAGMIFILFLCVQL
jgi:5'-3' exonuclease